MSASLNKKEPLKKARRGESLIEILMAFFVLASTSAAALVLVTQTVNASRELEDRLIANHLANDAIEVFASMRDTNRIKFQEKTCWDADLEEDDCGKNGGDKLLGDSEEKGFFKVILDPYQMRWSLEKVGKELQLNEEKPEKNKEMEIFGLYERTTEPNKGLLIGFKGNTPPETGNPKYYRMLMLERLGTQSAMRATIKVQWMRRGNLHEYALTNTFTNY